MLPYIGFPINKACPLRCQYCAPGAEAAVSSKSNIDINDLKRRANLAIEEGFTKFRLTGGEPLLHPKIGEILHFFSNLPAITTINTAAFLIEKKSSIFENLGPSLKVICSLDSLRMDRFNTITQTNKYFDATIKGIKIVANLGILKRLNMMVVRDNMDEVFDMIDFCSKLSCDLKVSDIAQATDQFENWNETHVNLKEIELEIARMANSFKLHPYTKQYGIPCIIYNVKGVNITVKSSYNGTTYSLNGHCKSCKHFPCEEGHYFINSMPDNSLSACRLNGYYIPPNENLKESFDIMKNMFEKVEYFKPSKLN